METITNIFSPFPLSVFNSNVLDQFDVQQFELSGNGKKLDGIRSAVIGAFGQIPLQFNLKKFRRYFQNFDDFAFSLYKKYLEVKLSGHQSKQSAAETINAFYKSALVILDSEDLRCSPREFLSDLVSRINEAIKKHPGFYIGLKPFAQRADALRRIHFKEPDRWVPAEETIYETDE